VGQRSVKFTFPHQPPVRLQQCQIIGRIHLHHNFQIEQGEINFLARRRLRGLGTCFIFSALFNVGKDRNNCSTLGDGISSVPTLLDGVVSLFASFYFVTATSIVASYDAQNGKIQKIEGITELKPAVRLGMLLKVFRFQRGSFVKPFQN
jgi:hypothetical protein